MSSTRTNWELAQSHFLFQDVIAPLRRFQDSNILLAFVDKDEETASRHAAYIPALFDFAGATDSIRLFNVKLGRTKNLVLFYDYLYPAMQEQAVLSYINVVAEYYQIDPMLLWQAIPLASETELKSAQLGVKELQNSFQLQKMLHAQDIIKKREEKKALERDQEDMSNRSSPSMPNLSEASSEEKSITTVNQNRSLTPDPTPSPSPSPTPTYSSIEDSWVPLSFFVEQYRRSNTMTPILASLISDKKLDNDDVAMSFLL